LADITGKVDNYYTNNVNKSNSYLHKNNKKSLVEQFRNTLSLQLMVLLPMVIFIIFHYIPIYGIIIAFQDFKLKEGFWGSPWVGLKNIIDFFNNPNFIVLLKNTFLLGFYGILTSTPSAITLALIINEVQRKYFKKFVQIVTCMPNFLSTVTIVGMMYLLFSPTGGVVNVVLDKLFNIAPIYFTASTKWYRPLFIGSNIWQHTGFASIYYLAALAGMSPELHESACIDGATRLQRIWYINLPHLVPTAAMLFILSMGGVLNIDTSKAILMYNPMNSEVSDVIGTYTYRRGLLMREYSLGASVGLIMSVVNFFSLVTFNWISRKIVKQSIW
jgi:putative aldouronate transport system permease protein